MPDLSIDFAGIQSPNPFWLAGAPPTNSGAQVNAEVKQLLKKAYELDAKAER